jgi:hypothetical protein
MLNVSVRSAQKIAKAGLVLASAINAGQITKRGATSLIVSSQSKKSTKKCHSEKCGKKCGKSGVSVTKIVSSAGKKSAGKKTNETKKIRRVQKISPRHCSKCLSLEHDIRVCPDTVTCGKCHTRGHNSRGCKN